MDKTTQEIDLTGVTPPVSNEPQADIDLDGVTPPPGDALIGAYKDTLDLDPVSAAKVMKLSKDLGEEEGFVAKNLPQAEKAAQAPSRSFAEEFALANPKAAEFLSDRRNMAVAKDDFDSLGQLESLVKQVSTGFTKGNLEARQAELWAERLADSRKSGQLSTKHEAELQALAKEIEPYSKIDESVGKNFHPVYQFAAQIPNITRAFVRVGAGEGGTVQQQPAADDQLLAGDVRGSAGMARRGKTAVDTSEMVGPAAATGAAGAVVGAVAGPGGAAAGWKLGTVPGLAMYAYQLEAGNAFKDYSQLKDKSGNPISPQAAADAAHTVGLVNAALETTGDLILMKVMAPVGKAAGGLATDGAVKVLSKLGIPGTEKVIGVLASKPKVFEGMTLGRAVREAGKLLLEGEVGEMSTEYLQEASTGIGQESAMSNSGQEFTDRKGFKQIAQDATGVLYPTFQSMLIPGIMGGGAHVFNSAREMKKVQATKQIYTAMGQAAETSKLRERLPESHKEFVEQVTKGSPIETIYVPQEAFETYFQSKKIDPEQAAAELGVTEELKTARDTGGDVAIPIANWTDKVVGTEHFNGLAEDVKFNPEDLTQRQATEMHANVGRQVEELVSQAQAAVDEDAARKQGSDLVYNEMKQDLVAAKPKGMGAKEEKAWLKQVESNASVWAARAVVESKRRGISVEDYWKQARPEIVTEDRPYRASILRAIREEVSAGNAEKGGLVRDADGKVISRFGAHSSYPEWFRGKGYSKDATLKAIDKYIAGEDLTEKQAEAIKDLYFSSGYANAKPAMAEANEPFLQEKAVAPAFYSKLSRMVEDKLPNKATAEQVRALTRDVNKEELKYSGLEQFLAGKEKISKEELLNFLTENQIQVKEVVKAEPVKEDRNFATWAKEEKGLKPKQIKAEWDSKGDLYKEYQKLNLESLETRKFKQYTLPGGENYREVLFTLPGDGPSADELLRAANKAEEDYNLSQGDVTRERDELIDLVFEKVRNTDQALSLVNAIGYASTEEKMQGAAAKLKEVVPAADTDRYVQAILRSRDAYQKFKEANKLAVSGDETQYKSPHWNERNVLAHTRLTDRVDAEGKTVLFVEEIQSDWHQEGRKKGYASDTTSLPEGYTFIENPDAKTPDQRWLVVNKLRGQENNQFGGQIVGLGETKEAALNDFMQVVQKRVPDAPFKKNWHEFVLKKILRMAAEGGYDRVAWTTGEQQAERYDLSKQVDSIIMQRLVTNGKENGQVTLRATKDGEDVLGNSSTMPESEVADVVGKEIYQKLKEQSDKGTNVSAKLEGESLKIGGDGMKGFYDKILPEWIAKYTKKWGGKVAETELDQPVKKVKGGFEVAGTFYKSYEDALADLEEAGGGGLKVHSLDITPAMKEAVIHEGQPLFQPGEGEGPRGSVQFANDSAVITLFKQADASTFLHESAHIWLKETFDYVRKNEAQLSEQYAKDWLTLTEWLQISPDQETLTVEQQEKFARGFEAYLREGNAPSEGLRKAFRLLRMWLTRIYHDVKGLNVEISDPVRSVLDRMLATEEEIEAARKEVAYEPAFVDLQGIPKEIAEDLQRLQEQAHEDAVGTLLKSQMDELKEERKTFIDERRAKIEKEVAREISQINIYSVMRDVRDKMKSKKSAQALAQEYLNGKLKGRALAEFDALSQIHVFSSADEMAKAILAAVPFQQKLTEEVRIRMAEYDDMKNSTAIKDAALQAIHNEKSLELMALEREILQAMIKKAEITAEVRKRRSAQARVEAQSVRQQAQDALSKMNVKQAVSFLPYFTQEKYAATRVGQALAEKDYERAASLKRMQMVSHAMAIESMKIKRKVEKWIGYLEDTQSKKVDLFKKEEHYLQVADLLDRMGFPRRDYNPKYKRESLAQWAERMNALTNTVSIPEWLLQSNENFDYRNMTLGQLQDVINAIKNIMTVANFENRALVVGKGATLDQIIGQLAMDAKLNVKEKDRYKPTMEPEKFDEAKRSAAKYLLSITKIQTLLRKLDGFKDGGHWFQTFWEPVYKAANEESRLMTWANEGISRLWSAYSQKEREEMIEKRVFYPEIGTSATKMRLIMMAMNLGNGQNKEKLFTTPPVGIDGATEWGQQVVMGLLEKHLTPKDWEFVQNTWDLINELWPQISKMHKEITGFSPGKVDAMPFNVKMQDGTFIAMKGGYFPLKEDPRASMKASIREQLDSPLYTEKNPAWVAATRTGHTKARTEAQYSIALDVTLIYRHLRDVTHDLAFRKTIIDLRRLLNDERMHGVIQEALGPEGYLVLREWVGAVASGNTTERTGVEVWEKMVGWLRRHATVAALMMKPSVIIQNLANPFLFSGAAEGFGSKQALNGFFVRGVLNYLPKAMFNWKAQKEIKDFVYSKSAFMRDKHETPDYSLSETHNKLFGQDSAVQEFATGLMSGSDELTAIPMWLEAYHSKMENGLVEEEEAIKYADMLIDRVLGSARKYDTPPIQRGTELSKSLSMFYSFLNTEYNRWAAEVGMAKLDPKLRSRLLGFVGSRLLFFVPASALLSGRLPGDDDDALKWWLKEIGSYPFQLLPGFREMAGVAMDEILGLRSFGYKPSPAVGAIEASLNAARQAGKVARGEAESQQFLEATSKAASYLGPYPDQFNAWFWNAYDYAVNGMEPQPSDAYRRRPRRER